MAPLLILFGCGLGMSLAFTPLVRRLSARCGLVDRPDGMRKMHARATPVAGGLAVLLAVALTLGAALLVPGPWEPLLAGQAADLLWLLVASVMICGMGMLDDLGYLRGRHKLAGQVLTAGVLVGSGLVVEHIQVFGHSLDLGIFAVPFTVLLLLGAINSLNLMDGMDGLLSTVGLIITLGMAAIAAFGGRWEAAAVAVTMAGALLGFLRYNYPPASIFLGDTGSMLIGLVVGVLA